MKIEDWIEYYQLEPHPEGGFFNQVEKSKDMLDEGNGKFRARYTSIYFLLTHENPSRFHRLTSDEIWYYHTGSPLTVHMISPEGEYQTVELGTDIKAGQVLQYTVPKGYLFGSTVEEPNTYALVSCMVAPGFEYDDFELFTRADMLDHYPQHEDIISRLTH
ncbi:cupin domain-containing protein [Aerococcaceae bacterium DSM 111022]|nr:cupin domain-containing protein [Aerococcaceae bacterium DSM 111022]MBG9989186.1 cupin domain-containing protein [Aerococcaceae bacterium DSM 111176]